jgi:dolichol-phosphate mannosyltransferase
MLPKTSLILPARNEEDNIRKMATMTLALYSNYIKEIIVVDDGSTDKTAEIVRSIHRKDKRVKLIRRGPPHGVGLAIRDGLRHVSKKAEYVFTLDADFVRNIPDLEDFFVNIKRYDGLIGSRYLEENSLIYYPPLKKFFNRIFHLLVNLIFGIHRSDITNNFKLYKKEIFNSLKLTSDNYAINAETGLYPLLLGFNIKELPVIWFTRDRNMGTSKFNLLKVAPGYIKVLINAIRIRRKLKSSRLQYQAPSV